jgi:hypothetical protein
MTSTSHRALLTCPHSSSGSSASPVSFHTSKYHACVCIYMYVYIYIYIYIYIAAAGGGGHSPSTGATPSAGATSKKGTWPDDVPKIAVHHGAAQEGHHSPVPFFLCPLSLARAPSLSLSLSRARSLSCSLALSTDLPPCLRPYLPPSLSPSLPLSLSLSLSLALVCSLSLVLSLSLSLSLSPCSEEKRRKLWGIRVCSLDRVSREHTLCIQRSSLDS